MIYSAVPIVNIFPLDDFINLLDIWKWERLVVGQVDQ